MSKASDIVAGLGGAGNIVEVEGCITRLRTEVKDRPRWTRRHSSASAPTA